ncbi:MAG: phosphatase PAP2 family protein [Gemmatimonadaceae bacterium]
MNVASPRLSEAAVDSASDRIIGFAGLLSVAYLAVMTWPLWMHMRTTGAIAPLVLHLATLACGALALGVHRGSPPFRVARDWLPLIAGPVMYVELRWIIAALGAVHRDALLMAWEARLFPSNPSLTLAPRMQVLALSELLHLAYASYYALVYVPPFILYVRRRRAEFAATMLTLTIVYGACFLAYALFPVDGPRYLVGPAAAPDGPVRRFVLALLEQGSSRGTAFPSSHVAASVVSALCTLQFQPRLGAVVTLIAALLTVATVYGGFHYAVDALVGVMLGLLAWLGAQAARTVLASLGSQIATAD